MSSIETFISVVQKAEHLPKILRINASTAIHIKDSVIDESYIEFLDGQIQLGVRSPEWIEQLKNRKAALLAFCN